MPTLRACGVLVFRRDPRMSFLLLRRPEWWDLPKGHVDAGESDMECALRELYEETGITAKNIDLDDDFRFQTEYVVHNSRRYPNQAARKSVLIFLAWLRNDVPIRLTEHVDFEWFDWRPPHQIQPQTIDPLLASVAEHLASSSDGGKTGPA